jgi:hypothetical protein
MAEKHCTGVRHDWMDELIRRGGAKRFELLDVSDLDRLNKKFCAGPSPYAPVTPAAFLHVRKSLMVEDMIRMGSSDCALRATEVAEAVIARAASETDEDARLQAEFDGLLALELATTGKH